MLPLVYRKQLLMQNNRFFIKKGDFFKFNTQKIMPFNEDSIWKIFLDLCVSMQHIHNSSTIHRDLRKC